MVELVRRTSVLAFAMLVACAAQTPVGLQPSRSPTFRRNPNVRVEPLWALGDSILDGAHRFGDLERLAAEAGWIPEFTTEVGGSHIWAMNRIEERAQVPRVCLVVIGANPGPGLRDFPDQIARIVQALRARGARLIVWIPPAHRDPERYAEKAQALRDAHLRGLVVPDWPSVAAANTHWFGDDGLHMTAAGYASLATFIRDELERAR